jgi:hypothetical protein
VDDVSSQCEHVHINERYSPYLYTDKTFAAVQHRITNFITLIYSSKTPHIKIQSDFNLLLEYQLDTSRQVNVNTILAFKYCKLLTIPYKI